MNAPANKPQLTFATAFAAMFFGSLAMGISPIFVRFAEVGPFASAFWRVALALPLLLVWAWIEQRKNEGQSGGIWRFDRAVLLAGVLFTGDLFFWHLAILNTTIANATLLACLAPVWVLLLSAVAIGEPVAGKAWWGLLFCLTGSLALVGTSFAVAPERLLGDFYGILTSFFFGLYFLAVRVGRRKHGAGALTFKSTLLTALLLFLITLLAGQGFRPDTLVGVSALLALGLISHSFGQGLLAVALGSLSAAFSSLIIFIEALAAALFAWMLIGEALSLFQILGGGLILLGVWIARPDAGTAEK